VSNLRREVFACLQEMAYRHSRLFEFWCAASHTLQVRQASWHLKLAANKELYCKLGWIIRHGTDNL